MNKLLKEKIELLEELVANLTFQRTHNYDDCDCELQKKLEDSSIQEHDLRDRIAELSKRINADKCDKIYQKVREAWTPDHRPFEFIEHQNPEKFAPLPLDTLFFRTNILRHLNHDEMMFLRDWLNTYDEALQINASSGNTQLNINEFAEHYIKEELTDSNLPFSYHAEGASSIRDFTRWIIERMGNTQQKEQPQITEKENE